VPCSNDSVHVLIREWRRDRARNNPTSLPPCRLPVDSLGRYRRCADDCTYEKERKHGTLSVMVANRSGIQSRQRVVSLDFAVPRLSEWHSIWVKRWVVIATMEERCSWRERGAASNQSRSTCAGNPKTQASSSKVRRIATSWGGPGGWNRDHGVL
jgi:hypothetical protein